MFLHLVTAAPSHKVALPFPTAMFGWVRPPAHSPQITGADRLVSWEFSRKILSMDTPNQSSTTTPNRGPHGSTGARALATTTAQRAWTQEEVPSLDETQGVICHSYSCPSDGGSQFQSRAPQLSSLPFLLHPTPCRLQDLPVPDSPCLGFTVFEGDQKLSLTLSLSETKRPTQVGKRLVPGWGLVGARLWKG